MDDDAAVVPPCTRTSPRRAKLVEPRDRVADGILRRVVVAGVGSRRDRSFALMSLPLRGLMSAASETPWNDQRRAFEPRPERHGEPRDDRDRNRTDAPHRHLDPAARAAQGPLQAHPRTGPGRAQHPDAEQNIAIEDAKAQATLHGVRITAASVNAARTLLSRMDSPVVATPTAKSEPAAPVRSARRVRTAEPVDAEVIIRGFVAKLRGQGNAEADRLREGIRKAIAVLQAAVG